MRIGMVGARFAGLDGVSLESAKLAEALIRGGHEIVWFAGEIGEGFNPSVVCDAAGFGTSENIEIGRQAFGGGDPVAVRAMIEDVAREIQRAFDTFIDEYDIETVIVENAWAIPMQLPLALAAARVIADRGIPAVGHHHDFSWERARFAKSSVPDLIESLFPPALPSVAHVVINSLAKRDLLDRRGLDSSVLPNVMDFETGPPHGDGGDAFRRIAGIGPGDTVLLQPTRVIRRKGIEMTIDLASAMDGNPVVVVTHPDDLDDAYWAELSVQADGLGVDLRIIDVGRELSALTSAYEAADLVCFPSLYEGYGNALVEAVYHRRPVLVNRYSVYVSDIAPLGFDFVEIDEEISSDAVARANRIVSREANSDDASEHNFTIGEAALSYSSALGVVERSFSTIKGL
ncbi:MAG: glycosyltransferase family 4 protein [Actinomycetia bacterium]|nr:glycosyltransferase family 4 protein [Actinomycetes bacterium]